MTNNTDDFIPADGAPSDQNDQKASLQNIKQYGKKSLMPVLQVMHKYQSDLTPYFSALSKGLDAGVKSLTAENATEAEKAVGQWFQQTSGWFNDLRTKFESKEAADFLNYIEAQAKQRPGFMFATSYFSGILMGRMGKYVGKSGRVH